MYAAQHLLRKLKEQFDITGSESGATEAPKKAAPRKRKADSGKAPATPKKKTKVSSGEAVSGQPDVESDDEVNGGSGKVWVKVDANGNGNDDEC
jgi:hypothetical protein